MKQDYRIINDRFLFRSRVKNVYGCIKEAGDKTYRLDYVILVDHCRVFFDIRKIDCFGRRTEMLGARGVMVSGKVLLKQRIDLPLIESHGLGRVLSTLM